MATVVVMGGNFAGITAALETRRRLKHGDHRVIVVANREHFLFVPSLIWVPFGEREIEDITLPLAPILEEHNVEFVHATATKILPDEHSIETTAGPIEYDYLVIATGPKLDYSVPGTNPKDGMASCICTPPDALETRSRFEALVDNPGPAVVGATPGAGCVGAAYEFLFNLEYNLRKRGVRDRVDLTWITPEPFLGHFGIGGVAGAEPMLNTFFKSLNIHYVANAAIKGIASDEVELADGRRFPFVFSMIMPPFMGQDVIRNSPGLGNAKGYVPVKPTYQHVDYPNIFAAGIAVDVPVPFTTPVALGVPKTGYPADEAGKTVGENIARLLNEKVHLKEKPFAKIPGLCVMDAGHKEVVIVTNHIMKPREFAAIIPNPIYDEGKRLFEKYFLWKTKHGYSYLP